MPGGREASVSQTKGAVFRGFLEWMQHEFGSDVTRHLHARLSPELKRMVDPDEPALGVLPSSWYPDELPNRILELLLQPMDEQARLRVLREGTRYTMEKTFRSIYRPLMRLFVSPERCAKLVQKAWQTNYDTGTATWIYRGPGLIDSEVTGWLGHHPYRCEISRVSGELLLELTGCKSVKSVRTACLSQGAPSCRAVITWT
jgi:hypothetical protein